MSYQEPAFAQPEKPQPWRATYRVFVEPAAAFENLGERPPVLPGYLVQMVLLAIAMVPTMQATFRLMEQQLSNTPGMTPEAMTIAKWAGLGGGALGALGTPWLAGAFTALIALLFGQFYGGAVPFGSYFGMIGYARVPLAVGQLLQGFMMFNARDLMDMQNISLSLAAFAPEGTSLALKAALGTINPFNMFYYVLIAIGFAALHRSKPSRGVALAVALYVIEVLLAMGTGALGSKFAPQI